MSIGSLGAPTGAQPSSYPAAIRQPSNDPVARGLAAATVGTLDVLLGRGGDRFDRSAPHSALLRNGILGYAGQGLAIGAGVLGTSLFVGMHVLTHPRTSTRASVLRSVEMGVVTLGGLGYYGISGATAALLGVARTPVNYLRTVLQRTER